MKEAHFYPSSVVEAGTDIHTCTVGIADTVGMSDIAVAANTAASTAAPRVDKNIAVAADTVVCTAVPCGEMNADPVAYTADMADTASPTATAFPAATVSPVCLYTLHYLRHLH